MKILSILLTLLSYEPKTSLRWLNLPMGARASGVGCAYTALGEDINVLFYNPSGLAWNKDFLIGVDHSESFGCRFSQLGLSIPLNFGTVSLRAQGYWTGEMERRRKEGPPEGTFRSFGDEFGLYWAKNLSPWLGFGIGTEAILFGIADSSGLGFSLKGGVQVKLPINLKFGLSLTDFGKAPNITNNPQKLPTRLRMGLAWRYNPISLSLDFVKPIYEQGIYLLPGMEYKLFHLLNLRLGYRWLGSDFTGGFCGGFGIPIKSLSVDYAFLLYGPLGISHRLGIQYSFTPKRKPAIPEKVLTKESLTSESFYNEGMGYLKDERYEEAISSFEKALIWDPENSKAEEGLVLAREELAKERFREYVKRGKDAYEKGDYLEALSNFQQAFSIDSTDTKVKEYLILINKKLTPSKSEIKSDFERGYEYYTKGEYRKAVQVFEDILRREPDNPEAKRYMKESLEKIKESISSILSRAERYERADKLRKALLELKRGLRVDPKSTAIKLKIDELNHKITTRVSKYLSSGIEEFNKGNYKEARRYFEMVIALDPKNRKAKSYIGKIPVSKKEAYDLYLKGIFAYTEENYELAISYWQEALKLDPSLKKIEKNIRRAEEKLQYLKK